MRLGCLDGFELDAFFPSELKRGIELQCYIGLESLLQALMDGSVEIALIDSVAAYLRSGDGISTSLMVGGRGYELVLNERGQLFQMGIATNHSSEKPKLGIDDFGSSLLMGGSLFKERGLSKWEFVRMPSGSLAAACEADIVQAYLRPCSCLSGCNHSIRRELAIVTAMKKKSQAGQSYRRLMNQISEIAYSPQELRGRFSSWEGCGSVEGFFAPSKRWEGWISSHLKSRKMKALEGETSYLLEL